MTARTSKVKATLERGDGGESMPLLCLDFAARFVRLVAVVASTMPDGAPEGYGAVMRSTRVRPFLWDLRSPPAAMVAPPPAHGSRWRHGKHRAEVHYWLHVRDADGLGEWPAGCRDALVAAGLALDDVIVAYGKDNASTPDAWMPLGRWQRTYGRSPRKSRRIASVSR
jgi:hypothetical protein